MTWSPAGEPDADSGALRHLARSGHGSPRRIVLRFVALGSQARWAMPDDPDALIRRLQKDAEHSHWPDLGRFSGGPKPNTKPLNLNDLDRAPSEFDRCVSVGYVNSTIGGPVGISPPFETRCIRRRGHDDLHYAMPRRLWLKWRWWQVWAWQ